MIVLYTLGFNEDGSPGMLVPEGTTAYSSRSKPITGRKAVLGIGKYGNDAVFVYADNELEDGVTDDLPGVTASDTIKSCNDGGRPGCWATQIPPLGKLSWLGISVRSVTYNPDNVETVAGDERVFWIPVSSGGEFSVMDNLDNVLTTLQIDTPSKILFPCLNDKDSLATASLPPVRRVVKRTTASQLPEPTET